MQKQYVMIRKLFLLGIIFMTIACRQEAKTTVNKEISVAVPYFSADSAYNYIERQVDFGPRVPNTNQHVACANYLVTTLKSFGATVIEQKVQLKAFNGDVLNANNIIASFNSEERQRILLFAHWDTRPWSDHDPTPSNFNKPVLGANDGASGVGVLLEIARNIGLTSPKLGIDIIFFDAEDYGAPESYVGNAEHSWCLGSQHWARNPHVSLYNARFGILLDMVGAKDAGFYKDQISLHFAPKVVENVWKVAQTLGFEKYFINKPGGSITDDHLYVNQITGIPSIDIIQYNPESKSGFGEYWHTTKDDMSTIDKNTLFAVGTTVMHVIYNEK